MQQAPPVASNLFGFVIPGRPVATDFVAVNSNKFVVEVHAPAEVPDLTFFLLPEFVKHVGYGALIYFSTPTSSYQNWELLGAVTSEKPSGIFRTGWGTNPDVLACAVVQVGVSIEPLDTINNLSATDRGIDDRKEFAKKIALDLFKFMSSFTQTSPNGEVIVVPSTIIDQWLGRFEQKYRRDPNFMMRSTD